mgnify:CR=1 FL=1
MNNLKDYIVESYSTKNILSIYDVYVQIKDPIENTQIQLDKICLDVKRLLKKELLMNIDVIYIGVFEELEEKNVQALYKDRTIYLSNKIKTESELIKNIIHEVAHSLEDISYYENIVYGDNTLEQEFLMKRKTLFNILQSNGCEISNRLLLNTDYTKELDDFLYKFVGYNRLSGLLVGLVVSPYALTSLKEYFANGFEFLLYNKKQQHFLKQMCPVLYDKLDNLIYLDDYV